MAKKKWTVDHPLVKKAKEEYLTTSISINNVAEKHGIPRKALFIIYKMDDWKLKKANGVPLAASDELIKHETKQLNKITWGENPCVAEALELAQKQINSSLSLLDNFKLMLQRKINYMEKHIESVEPEQVEIISKALDVTTKATNQNLDFYYKLVKENEQPKNVTHDSQSFSDIDKERQQLIQ